MAARSLFAAHEPVDGELSASLSDYERLCKRAESWAYNLRAVLDQWFSRLPPETQASIASRFVSARRESHLGAFHELYQHELSIACGFGVDCDVGREDPAHVRPDLLLSLGDKTCFVEVTVTHGDDVVAPDERPRVNQLYDAINRMRNRDFLLMLDLRGVGSSTPGKRFTGQIARWLDGYDADDEIRRVQAGGQPARRRFELDGWKLIVTAVGYRRELRGRPDLGLIGTKTEGLGGYKRVFEGEKRIEIDGPRALGDVEMIRRSLTAKIDHGYRLEDRPFVVAILCAGSFVEDRDIAEALIGPGGIWPNGSGARRSRLSGVLTVARLAPFGLAAVEPTLWTNPDADHPVPRRFFPWREIEFQAGGVCVEHDAVQRAAAVLGLGERFPLEGGPTSDHPVRRTGEKSTDEPEV